MARPSLDQIFASQQQRPSLDNIFGSTQQQASPNPQQMAQQVSTMPTGQQLPQISVNPGLGYGMNTMPAISANSLLGPDANKEAIAANIALQAKNNAIGTEAKQAAAVTGATKLSESDVAAQQKVAEENSTMDAFTNGLRELSKDYGKAYVNGYAGNSVNELWGKLATNGMIPPNGHEVGQKGYSAFQSLQSTLIPSLNSVYSTQFGGQEPSTRIMASLLDLAHKELPQLGKTIPADEGSIQSGLQRFGTVLTGSLQYLKNNFNSQQLLEAYKKNPKILDQYAAQAFKNADAYQLSPEVSAGLQDRYNKIIQPLEAAKQGKVVYDVPKEGNKTYIIPNGMAKDFEKEKGL